MKKYVFMIATCFIFIGCMHEVTCEELENHFRNLDVQMIITDPDTSPNNIFSVKGTDLITGKKRKFTDVEGYYLFFHRICGDQYLEEGDTLIKVKGTTVFNFHKKHGVCKAYVSCDGMYFDQPDSLNHY